MYKNIHISFSMCHATSPVMERHVNCLRTLSKDANAHTIHVKTVMVTSSVPVTRTDSGTAPTASCYRKS